jgi:hypothetical protein
MRKIILDKCIGKQARDTNTIVSFIEMKVMKVKLFCQTPTSKSHKWFDFTIYVKELYFMKNVKYILSKYLWITMYIYVDFIKNLMMKRKKNDALNLFQELMKECGNHFNMISYFGFNNIFVQWQ